MTKKETVEVLVDGGKATAGPAMGSSLGPLRVNISDVLKKINQETKDFKGMKVPVKITVDTETKEFSLTIGTPPASQLLKSEINIDKGTGAHKRYDAGVIAIEQVIKVAKMKKSNLIINSLKSAVKTMVGSCITLGILVEGKNPREVLKEIDEGKYNNEIDNEITEVPEEKKNKFAEIQKDLDEKKKAVFREIDAKKASDEAKAAKKAAKVVSQAKKK